MVDTAFSHQRHGLKATVRVTGEAGNRLAVVHGKAVLGAEIAAHLAALELHGLHTHLAVAGRVSVIVVSAEQKRIQTRPAWAEWDAFKNGFASRGHGVLLLRAAAICRA